MYAVATNGHDALFEVSVLIQVSVLAQAALFYTGLYNNAMGGPRPVICRLRLGRVWRLCCFHAWRSSRNMSNLTQASTHSDKRTRYAGADKHINVHIHKHTHTHEHTHTYMYVLAGHRGPPHILCGPP